MSPLISKATLGTPTLQNHLVMTPMSLNRGIGNIPNALMAEFSQCGSAGRIVTEGTIPSPNGLGYPRIMGTFSAAQVAGWKPVADAAHAKGAKLIMQFMHCVGMQHIHSTFLLAIPNRD